MTQKLTINVRFKANHVPGTEEHLLMILRNYLRPKGIELKDDKTIEL